jgi:hypothetical protein
VVLLGGLVLFAGYLVYSNVLSGLSVPKTAARVAAAVPEEAPVPAAEAGRATSPRAGQTRGRSDEFHPVLQSKRPEERINTEKVDPTLRLDLLAKLQEVELPGTGRNLFQTGPPPVKAEPLKGPEPKVIPQPVVARVEPPSGPPPGPPPLNIGLKYYGFSSAPGNSPKTAFFLDGDDIFMAREGETVKRRYLVVRIGVNSVVMEDTESKRQQTIPLAEEAG